MLMLSLLLLAGPQSVTPADLQRYDRCVGLAQSDPAAAQADAGRWRIAGGRYLAQQCSGIAHATAGNWVSAAAAFTDAAHAAEIAKDDVASGYWAQAGNAWLAAGEPAKARAALDAALATPALTGLQRGEAQLDRARALVAADDLAGARGDIDSALTNAAADPLAWLLSATLARRVKDLPRARHDIAEALKRAADDASVQLEAGNIAAMGGNEAAARAAWAEAARIAPDTPIGKSAIAALRQFDGSATD